MKTHIRAMFIAFATYSRLPVPNVPWDEDSMKYSICYFPLVGVPIALLEILAWWGCQALGLGDIFRSALMTVIPIMVTGGIHLDGFCDTSDALSSYQPMERKLEILKDSHVGAFAVIRVAVYLILYFGAVSGLNSIRSVVVYGITFCIERALSGLTVVNLKNARGNGMLHSFSSVADRKAVTITMLLYCVVCMGTIFLLDPISGVVTLLVALGVTIYYRLMSYRTFGGITGDLAGYYLQLLELLLIVGRAVTIKC